MKLQLVAKNFFKKWRGDPLETWKNFRKIFFEIFEQCHSAEKCKRGDPLRFFDIHCVAKHQKKLKGGPFGGKNFNPRSFKKSHSSEKKWGSLVWFRGCGRLFCFFFSFWTLLRLELLRFEVVEVVEQMNKKWTFRVLKKTTHCNSRAHFLLKCAD